MGCIKWTQADSKLADFEGWNVFHVSGASDGRQWGIEKVDEKAVFATNEEAWRFVMRKANEGGLLHLKALMFLLINEPNEYDNMMALERCEGLIERTKALQVWAKDKEAQA